MFHGSEVVIQGHHLAEIPKLLGNHGYVIERTTAVTSDKLAAVLSDFDRTVVVGYFEDGWTHVFDVEMTLANHEELWTAFTRTHRVRVVGWIAESTSGTLALWDYGAGSLRREVIAVDGNVTEGGAAISEEKGTAWEVATAGDLFDTLERLGAPYREMKSDVNYHVYDVAS